VLLGFAALAFLTTQITSRGLHFGSAPHYDVTAKFDNIGDLKVGAPVSMAGVEVGRVSRIDSISKNTRRSCSCASIRNTARSHRQRREHLYSGSARGKFIGLTAGGADTYLKDKGEIDFTQSAFVLENLIGQLLANFAKGSNSSGSSGSSTTDAPATTEKHK